jgi:hypothetical protein
VVTIAFDVQAMRPGCVLLQAAYGCSPSVAHGFPTEAWLLAPTDTLRVYEVSPEQLAKLEQMVKGE